LGVAGHLGDQLRGTVLNHLAGLALDLLSALFTVRVILGDAVDLELDTVVEAELEILLLAL